MAIDSIMLTIVNAVLRDLGYSVCCAYLALHVGVALIDRARPAHQFAQKISPGDQF